MVRKDLQHSHAACLVIGKETVMGKWTMFISECCLLLYHVWVNLKHADQLRLGMCGRSSMQRETVAVCRMPVTQENNWELA